MCGIHDALAGGGACDDECHEVGGVLFTLHGVVEHLHLGQGIAADGKCGQKQHVAHGGIGGGAHCKFQDFRQLSAFDVLGEVHVVGRGFQAFNVISLLMFDVCALICVQKKCKIFSRMQNLECHEG